MLARHHPSARSSNPSGGAAYGSTNAAESPRSSNGGGCPQQTSSAQDPSASSPSPVPASSPVTGKFASSAVTNRSGCSERAIRACSRTARPARLGSVGARARQAFRTDWPVWLAGRPLPITSPTSSRTPNAVAITSWISPPPPWVAGRWRDSTYSRPTRIETGRVMVGISGREQLECSQPTTTCCANREFPATISQLFRSHALPAVSFPPRRRSGPGRWPARGGPLPPAGAGTRWPPTGCVRCGSPGTRR
jgi:hypothetical protein